MKVVICQILGADNKNLTKVKNLLISDFNDKKSIIDS